RIGNIHHNEAVQKQGEPRHCHFHQPALCRMLFFLFLKCGHCEKISDIEAEKAYRICCHKNYTGYHQVPCQNKRSCKCCHCSDDTVCQRLAGQVKPLLLLEPSLIDIGKRIYSSEYT